MKPRKCSITTATGINDDNLFQHSSTSLSLSLFQAHMVHCEKEQVLLIYY